MKKLIVSAFLCLYLASFAKPFVPALLNYVSTSIWEISHKNHVKHMSGRVNFLLELADMAKHNSPKDHSSPSDTCKESSTIFLCLLPKFNFAFFLNMTPGNKFPSGHALANLVFQQNTTPPPELA